MRTRTVAASPMTRFPVTTSGASAVRLRASTTSGPFSRTSPATVPPPPERDSPAPSAKTAGVAGRGPVPEAIHLRVRYPSTAAYSSSVSARS